MPFVTITPLRSVHSKGVFAHLRRDIRTCLHHCWANSLVNVCDAAREALKEMRPHAALVSHALCTTRVHEMDKRVLSLPTCSQMPPTMAVSCAFLCAVKLHTSIDPLPGQAMSGLSDHEVLGVRAVLHCDIRASLHSSSAQLLLCVCEAGFQGTANCVLTWRLRR